MEWTVTKDGDDEIKNVEIMTSQKNNTMLLINGYKFKYQKLVDGNLQRWRCVRSNCTASLKLNIEGDFVERKLTHNHEQEKTLKGEDLGDGVEPTPTEPDSSATQVSPNAELKTLAKPDLSNIRRKVFLALQNPGKSAEKEPVASGVSETTVPALDKGPAENDPLSIDIKFETSQPIVKIETMEAQMSNFHTTAGVVTTDDTIVNISDSDSEDVVVSEPNISKPPPPPQPTWTYCEPPPPSTPSTSRSAHVNNSLRPRAMMELTNRTKKPIRTKRELCNDDFGKFVASYLTKLPEHLEDGVKFKIHEILYEACNKQNV